MKLIIREDITNSIGGSFMYLKINGNLVDVLGENARKNLEELFGIKVVPVYQFLDGEIPITLAEVVDETKAQNIIQHSQIVVLNTKEEVNAAIDENYIELYILKDSTELSIDLNLSGNPTITGYDSTKPLSSQTNLKSLYDANMGGISKNIKPPYLT